MIGLGSPEQFHTKLLWPNNTAQTVCPYTEAGASIRNPGLVPIITLDVNIFEKSLLYGNKKYVGGICQVMPFWSVGNVNLMCICLQLEET